MSPISRQDEYPDEIVTGGIPWVLDELEDGTHVASSLWALTDEEREQIAACGTLILARYQDKEGEVPKYILVPGEEKVSPWYQHGQS